MRFALCVILERPAMPPTPGFLKALLLPPANLLVLAGVGWLLYRRRPVLGRRVVVFATALLYALSTPVIGNALLKSLESSPAIAVLLAVFEASLAAHEHGQSVRCFASQIKGVGRHYTPFWRSEARKSAVFRAGKSSN